MAVVTFSKTVAFPIAAVRASLAQHLPQYSWQCGEDDVGAAGQTGDYRPHILVTGRSSAGLVFIELRVVQGRLDAPSPPHEWHLEVAEPTTDERSVASRASLAICGAVMLADEEGACCRLEPDGVWLTVADLRRVLNLVLKGEDISVAEGIGIPSAHFARAAPGALPEIAPPLADRSPQERSALLGVDTVAMASLQRTLAKALGETGDEAFARQMGYARPPSWMVEGVREDRLPTMVLLVDGPKPIDWPALAEAFGIVDPDGCWTLDGHWPDGSLALAGRGCRITLDAVAEPVPDYLLEPAFARSHWFPDGAPRLRARGHGAQLVMRCDLDTRAAPWVNVRQTAKVASLLLGLAARHGDVAALYNAGIATIIDTDNVVKLTGHLHKDEIPIQMWTWAAPHSLEADAISFTTGGFAPFLGYEVEVWNAPGDRDFVVEKANGALRYLLIEGPVVNHGDTMGEEAGDRSIRCFFGDSKADRARPVRAMFLEFSGPASGAPHPDLAGPSAAPSSAPPAAPDATLLSLVALTRGVAFAQGEMAEMLARNFPSFAWTVGDGGVPSLQRPQPVVGHGPAGEVTVRIDARVEALPAAIWAPPHRVHVRVSVDTGGDMGLARAVSLVICACVIISQDKEGHFQLSVDGNWLSHDDALTAVVLPGHAPDIGDFDRAFGTPPKAYAGRMPWLDGAAPPATDGFEARYAAIRCPPRQGLGERLRDGMIARGSPTVARPAASPAVPAPRAAGFGNRAVGGFGRKGL